MAYFQGKSASIASPTKTMPATDWSLNLQCDLIDVTNQTSDGFNENLDGVFKASIQASGPYDGTLGVVLGASVTFTLKVGQGGGDPSFSVPARVGQVDIKTSVRGPVEWDISAESNGAWTLTY